MPGASDPLEAHGVKWSIWVTAGGGAVVVGAADVVLVVVRGAVEVVVADVEVAFLA
jgi:hypothetical protein